MSMFPHTVTVYNTVQETDPETFEDTLTNYITVLTGVLVDETKAANVAESGLEGADAVNLYIPTDVTATDGVTGAEKTFVGPMEFWSAEDKSSIWTLSVDGNGGTSFFVRGTVVEETGTFESINLLYDGVYNITKVDNKDFGNLSHWQVGGA